MKAGLRFRHPKSGEGPCPLGFAEYTYLACSSQIQRIVSLSLSSFQPYLFFLLPGFLFLCIYKLFVLAGKKPDRILKFHKSSCKIRYVLALPNFFVFTKNNSLRSKNILIIVAILTKIP